MQAREPLDGNFFVTTLYRMDKKRGAPRKPAGTGKTELLQLRLSAAEKLAFSQAADLDGKKTSEWIRDRLRRLSREELQSHGLTVPFLPGNVPGERVE